jgi:hypothetical protein
MTFPRNCKPTSKHSLPRRYPLIPVWAAIAALAAFSAWLSFWPNRHRAHSPLQAAVWRLNPAMSRDQVGALFREFAEHESEFKGGRPGTNDFQDPPVFFQSNLPAGMRITYAPTAGGLFSMFESCEVYFDANGIITGYHYSYDR